MVTPEIRETQEIEGIIPTSGSFSLSFWLKTAEYLCLSGFIGIVITLVLVVQNPTLFVYMAAFFAAFLFFNLLDRQLTETDKATAKQQLIAKQAELFTSLIEETQPSLNRSLVLARQRALQYSQDLIDDYKKLRRDSRNIYYISQFLTIVLSGLTPILVLLDKLDLSITWIKWLPVIFPAIASIVASGTTSFPFQENAIKANAAVESLEAEQEKFVLGVTPLYRCFDITDETLRQQQAKQAIENYINQINEIHLKQVQESSKSNNPAGDSQGSNLDNAS